MRVCFFGAASVCEVKTCCMQTRVQRCVLHSSPRARLFRRVVSSRQAGRQPASTSAVFCYYAVSRPRSRRGSSPASSKCMKARLPRRLTPPLPSFAQSNRNLSPSLSPVSTGMRLKSDSLTFCCISLSLTEECDEGPASMEGAAPAWRL